MDITEHKTQEMVLSYSHRDGKHIQAAMSKLEDKMQSKEIKTTVIKIKEA